MEQVGKESDEDKIPGEDDDIDIYGNTKNTSAVKTSSKAVHSK